MFKNVLTRSIPSPVTFDIRKIGHTFDLVNFPCSSVQPCNRHTDATTTASMLSMNIGVFRHPPPFKIFSNCFSVSSKTFLGVYMLRNSRGIYHINLGNNNHHRDTKAHSNAQMFFAHSNQSSISTDHEHNIVRRTARQTKNCGT